MNITYEVWMVVGVLSSCSRKQMRADSLTYRHVLYTVTYKHIYSHVPLSSSGFRRHVHVVAQISIFADYGYVASGSIMISAIFLCFSS